MKNFFIFLFAISGLLQAQEKKPYRCRLLLAEHGTEQWDAMAGAPTPEQWLRSQKEKRSNSSQRDKKKDTKNTNGD